MTMITALYIPLDLSGVFIAFRISLLSRRSRAMIIIVRRTSSETETEYVTPMLMAGVRQMGTLGCEIDS